MEVLGVFNTPNARFPLIPTVFLGFSALHPLKHLLDQRRNPVLDGGVEFSHPHAQPLVSLLRQADVDHALLTLFSTLYFHN